MGKRSRDKVYSSYIKLVLTLLIWIPLQANGSEHKVSLSDIDIINKGRKLFAQSCSVGYCHGKEGRAGRGPRLRGKTWDREYLYRVILKGIPKTAMPGWEGKLSHEEILTLVAYIGTISSVGGNEPGVSNSIKTGEKTLFTNGVKNVKERFKLAGKINVVAKTAAKIVGNSGRGRELFFNVMDDMNCAVCHRIEDKGASIGFGLIRIADNSPRQIFRDIVLPSQRVEEAGRLSSLVMKDGEEFKVLMVGESPTRLRVFDISSFPPVTRSVKKEEIRSLMATGRSAMPDSYAHRYTLQQLLDLVAFIKSKGSSSDSLVTLRDIL
ncbi:MAG: hypothetical protein DF168_00620 [Candidatus Moanabacter tarae]|uniref:Cytochrome c domain-containing protein n=1 Tax=Candidatus Moanibacter tarae TaxID=2200854 RepID=A0A2Z4ABY7_9BACT|nr:MAG: hypothetical protein DF168_00620 [Candidatus Moanabacter tarae]